MATATAGKNVSRFQGDEPVGVLALDRFSWSAGRRAKGFTTATLTYKVQVKCDDMEEENLGARITQGVFAITKQRLENILIRQNRLQYEKAGRGAELPDDPVFDVQNQEKVVLALLATADPLDITDGDLRSTVVELQRLNQVAAEDTGE